MFDLIKRLLAGIPAAEAHCDTADGPAVADGRRALKSGNLNYALKWIPADGEAELREVFGKAMAVRKLGPEAAEVADRLFLETLVRIHRMAEGVGFTGIQGPGAHVEPVVVAADRALDDGNLEPLRALVPPERFGELATRFARARGKRDFAVDDVKAGRDFIAAYVSYFKYAEGEEHDHASRAGHAHHGHH
ncbi:MAG: hypothetical protein IT515_12025 [Burkholderiales bacterium]|nr:hypothetical protein [Burkholderiales bacterium]